MSEVVDALERKGRVMQVEPLDGYRLFVEFDDGLEGEVDLSNGLFGPVFEPLKDPEFFSQASIDEFGVIR